MYDLVVLCTSTMYYIVVVVVVVVVVQCPTKKMRMKKSLDFRKNFEIMYL